MDELTMMKRVLKTKITIRAYSSSYYSWLLDCAMGMPDMLLYQNLRDGMYFSEMIAAQHNRGPINLDANGSSYSGGYDLAGYSTLHTG